MPFANGAKAVAVSTVNAASSGCLWELRRFYELRRPLNKWLTGQGRQDSIDRFGGGCGAAAVEQFARLVCQSLRPVLVLARKQALARAQEHTSEHTSTAAVASLYAASSSQPQDPPRPPPAQGSCPVSLLETIRRPWLAWAGSCLSSSSAVQAESVMQHDAAH